MNSLPEESSSNSDSSGVRASVSQGQSSDIVESVSTSMIRVTDGSEVEYEFSDSSTPVLGISFNAKSDEGLVVAKVQVLSESPGGIDSPTGTSYQLMNIDVGSKGTISKDSADNILIDFKVSKEWIEENNIDISTIRMTRYHDGQWQDLPTSYVSEDDEFVYFKAQTPGFSIFSVVGDQIKEALDQETFASVTPADQSNFEDESEGVEEKNTPGFTMLSGLVFASFAALVRRKFD